MNPVLSLRALWRAAWSWTVAVRLYIKCMGGSSMLASGELGAGLASRRLCIIIIRVMRPLFARPRATGRSLTAGVHQVVSVRE